MNRISDKPITYLITRGEATEENVAAAMSQILNIIELAVELKVSMVQIREKKLSLRRLCELTESAAKITRQSSTKLLVNDRFDVAKACGADGVHLTTNSVPAKVVRALAPHNFVIGVSAHSLEDVRRAAADGADFAALAPIFATPGKGEPLGIERLSGICEAVDQFPVLALGGVDETNFVNVVKAGASGFAAIRSMNCPESLKVLMSAVKSQ